jgi:hypothetical protein
VPQCESTVVLQHTFSPPCTLPLVRVYSGTSFGLTIPFFRT